MHATRIKIHSGPDALNRYHYTLYWIADYHPGDPRGEYRIAERGQNFHAQLPEEADMHANETNDTAPAYCEEHGHYDYTNEGCPECLAEDHADNVDTDEDGKLW